MSNLKHKKIEHDGEDYYVMMNKRTKVSVGHLPKIWGELIVRDLAGLKECGGKVIWIDGKNVIGFKSEESVKKAIDYVDSVTVMKKLK